ncbi:P-loop containing nucleoside triphosphate hydrolase protein [Gorgonomyces haynaldii]|nr:P-loop containing nucleoside triphosphate hydrolase protein [Gorgonomyces haynaldii]
MSENVQVVCRCRPFNERELAGGHTNVTDIKPDRGTISLKNPKQESDVKAFTFDAVFDDTCTQMEVYSRTARSIVDSVLEGFNGTVFVYGQTGTGKTFSMQGVPDVPHLRGIIPTCFHHIFDHIARTTHKQFLVRVSFLEIYNEEIKDLLVKPAKNPKGGLDLKEHPETGVYVKDLAAIVVKSVEEMDNLMTVGNKHRSVGATLMNENSSRSHSIFSITIESSEPGLDGEPKYVSGKLHLVDLAGSERQSKTGATGDRLKEATKINLSLSALGNCISALVDGRSSHIPYRDSKLTRLLQDSLGGNAKTLMIATLSPASYNYDETLSTLRYANRAKSIKNKPIVNEDPKDAMLKEYQKEIERLREALKAKQTNAGATKVITKVIKKQVKKKIAKPKKQGEAESSDDEDDINPLEVLDPETIARMQQEIENEKKALLQSTDMVREEKQRLAEDLEKRAQALEIEKQEREKIEMNLKNLEAKLLVGGVNIVEKLNEQELALEESQKELQEQQRRERELRIRLEAKQEAQMQLEESFSSLQEEVDVKTKNLNKLWTKFQTIKSEINDTKDEFRLEREDLLDTIRELSKEISLKATIIENFIPPEECEKIEKKAVYDTEKDDWTLKKVPRKFKDQTLQRPKSVSTIKRPLCQYGKILMSMGDPTPRYRYDNIISVSLELPERTTLQNEAPRTGGKQISPLQGALDLALSQDNEELFVTSNLMGNSIYTSEPKLARDSKSRTDQSRSTKELAQYPSSKAERMKAKYI